MLSQPVSTQQDKIRSLIAQLGGLRDEELSIGGYTVTELARRFGTPYFVYSGDRALSQLERVQQALGPDTEVYFSIKANPSLGLCQLFARAGVGAEIASGGEALLARKAGFAGKRIIFAGPGKTTAELELAVDLGIGTVHVESPGELGRLRSIARAKGRPVAVGIRINPHFSLIGAKMRMGGGSQQFGIDEESVPDIIRQYRDDAWIRIIGIHVYTGTQIFDIEQLLGHYQRILDLAAEVTDYLGRPLSTVDLGGGFGVPYFEKNTDLDLASLAPRYRQLVEHYRQQSRLADTRFIIELGRYLVASAGLYVTRVVDVKQSRGKTYVVTDGGMNHQTMATGNFGQVFREAYPVAVLNRLSREPTEHASVVGPCCTPLDVIGNDLELAEARVDDLIGIFYSGAYGYSASSLSFLSHPTPAEILIWEGNCYPLREQGSFDQVLLGQCPLPL